MIIPILQNITTYPVLIKRIQIQEVTMIVLREPWSTGCLRSSIARWSPQKYLKSTTKLLGLKVPQFLKLPQRKLLLKNIQVPFISAGQDLPTCEVNETAQEVTYKVCFAYTGCFFTGTPPKSSKYKKVNLS